MSLFLYPRKDSQFWWVGGKVYLGNKYITVRQSTKCIAKRDAKEELRNIETKALARLKGNGTPSVPFSNSVIKWTKLQKRSDGDLWNAQLLLRFFRDRDIYAITLDDWQRFTIKSVDCIYLYAKSKVKELCIYPKNKERCCLNIIHHG